MSLAQGAPEINIPKAATPAVAASSPRADTGAAVQLGTSVKDQRISGSTGTAKSKTVDVLGGLGVSGGLNV